MLLKPFLILRNEERERERERLWQFLSRWSWSRPGVGMRRERVWIPKSNGTEESTEVLLGIEIPELELEQH